MSAPIPKTAMVFAAGLGQRMRPVTDTLPKPLVKVRGRTLIDHCLDRLAENGVETAIVNVHWLADQIEAHLRRRERPRIVISDERGRLLDQGGGIKRALKWIGREPFLICNTDAFWIEGPRSNIARLAQAFDREAMDIALLVAASAGAVGVDWPGDFTMTREGRLERRVDRHVAPFVYTGVGISSRNCSPTSRRTSSASPPFSTPPPPQAASTASASTASGSTSAGPNRSTKRNGRSSGRPCESSALAHPAKARRVSAALWALILLPGRRAKPGASGALPDGRAAQRRDPAPRRPEMAQDLEREGFEREAEKRA